MLHTREWSAKVFLFEQDGQTRADAVLDTGENALHGYGAARCRSGEKDVPEIGDELAAARALSDLGHKLIGAAAGDLEGVGQQPVQLSGSRAAPLGSRRIDLRRARRTIRMARTRYRSGSKGFSPWCGARASGVLEAAGRTHIRQTRSSEPLCRSPRNQDPREAGGLLPATVRASMRRKTGAGLPAHRR